MQTLTIKELKTSIYKYFRVENTQGLKASVRYRMMTENLESDVRDLRLKSTWETLYREFVGILPHEENQEGYGCINGINVFNYFKPWQVFGLDGQTATEEDTKKAYRNLAKIYHPDNPETGDRLVFERIHRFYESLGAMWELKQPLPPRKAQKSKIKIKVQTN